MLKSSGSLLFPFKYDGENNCLLRAFTIEDTLMSAIRCFLVTRRGSRVGNNVGSFLPELLMQTVPTASLSGLATELRNELTEQFPGVEFLNVTMVRGIDEEVTQLVVTITFTSAGQENISELILIMPSIFDASNLNQIQNSF